MKNTSLRLSPKVQRLLAQSALSPHIPPATVFAAIKAAYDVLIFAFGCPSIAGLSMSFIKDGHPSFALWAAAQTAHRVAMFVKTSPSGSFRVSIEFITRKRTDVGLHNKEVLMNAAVFVVNQRTGRLEYGALTYGTKECAFEPGERRRLSDLYRQRYGLEESA